MLPVAFVWNKKEWVHSVIWEHESSGFSSRMLQRWCGRIFGNIWPLRCVICSLESGTQDSCVIKTCCPAVYFLLKYFIALMNFYTFNSISLKLFCWLMCPLSPSLFLRFQGQVAWSDYVRKGKIRKSLPRPDSLQSLCFSLSALAEPGIETCVQRSIEVCEGKKNERTGGENGHQGQSHLQMRDFPITAFCSSWISHSVSPSIINFFLTPFDLYRSLLLFNDPPTISLCVMLSPSASLFPVLVRSKSIHPSRQHRVDRLMPAQSSESRSDQLSCSQSVPYLSEIPPSVPRSPAPSHHPSLPCKRTWLVPHISHLQDVMLYIYI